MVAGGTIAPLRAVKMSAAWTVVQASAPADTVVGFVDASTNSFDGVNHAVSGQPVTLQSGPLLQAEAGAAITAGARVEVDSVGRVVPSTGNSGTISRNWIALEAAAGAGSNVWILDVGNQIKLS
jgi:hypothetical protein